VSTQLLSDLPELQTGNETDEEALEDALENWLPAAYESSTYESTSRAAALQKRIAALSNQLSIRHHDSWLKEFLKFSQHPQFSSAVGFLARTIKENQSGHPDEALITARRAQHLFASMRNSAGQRRADFEEIYALQRLANSRACLDRIARIERAPSLSSFPWLRAQLLLEKSTCVGRRGDVDQAIHQAQRGAEVARNAGFGILTLRALGMLSELKATVADDDASWRIAQRGLKQFWQGGFPAIRGYQFYGSIGYTAENAEQWQLATALNLQAVALATQTNNKSIEAMARYRLAGDALMAGNNSLAAKQFERAEALFAALPETESWKIYQAYSQIVLAGLEAHREKLNRSRELLQKSVPNVMNIDDFIIQLSYNQTHGELQVKNGQVAAAKESFLSALHICRAWLTSLHDESDRVAVERFAGDIYRNLVDIVSSTDSQPDQGLALWQEYRALSGAQRESHQTFQAAAGPFDSTRLMNSVREQLRTLHDRTLLTFVQFHNGVGVWVSDDRGIFFQRVGLSASKLERKIRHFHALCSQRNSDLNEIRADGRELYNLLLAPVASRLDYRRVLLIDADESLKHLPFQAIVDSHGRYFGQTVPIINSAGLSFEVKMGHRDDSVLFRQNATILAPTAPLNLGRDLLPLKDAIQEAQSVASHFSRHTLLLREEATRDALRSALSNSATFHFAGHAILNSDQVGLVLAGKDQSGKPETEFFSADDIKKEISPGLRLVVLAACSTGISGEDDLYGRGNLAQAFLQARVGHVVATRWDVDSEATESLMEQFYSALEHGKSVAEALQYAQQRVLLNQSTAEPYYWAAFAATGSS